MRTETNPAGIRLQKRLAQAGICSRRAAEALIREGRVKLNGKTVTALGTLACPDDRILVDGRPLPERPQPVYLALNKPAGIVTTLRDPEARGTVRDFLPHGLAKVFPVGRLDVQSTGLLLLTNDGELTARLTHPRHHVPRTYRVKVRGVPDERALGRLRCGLRLHDGPTGPVQVVIEKALPTKSWLCVTVYEGRTRLVRRLCDAIGHRAEKLQRIAIGPLELGKLALGTCRLLTPPEVRTLRRTVGLAPAARGADHHRSPRSRGRRRER